MLKSTAKASSMASRQGSLTVQAVLNGGSWTETAARRRSPSVDMCLNTARGTVRTFAGLAPSMQQKTCRSSAQKFIDSNNKSTSLSNEASCSQSLVVRSMSTTEKSPQHTDAEGRSSSSSLSSTRNTPGNSPPVNLAYISYERKDSAGKSPLVVHHGLFGCKENWKKVSKEINLISKRSVFAVDGRNHGESPHSSEMSLPLMARDISHFVNQIQLGKVSFMGHSFGGRVGMMLALMYPKLLDKLVVVDTTPLSVQDSAFRYNLILRATAVLKNMEPELRQCHGYNRGLAAEKAIEHILKDKRDIAVVLSNLINLNHGSGDVVKAREVTTNGVKVDPNSIWRVNLDSILSNPSLTDFPDLDDKLAYHGKTLFIQGKMSRQMKPSDEPRIRRLFPNAEFVWMEETGHWLHLEKHKEFLQCALQFLEKK